MPLPTVGSQEYRALSFQEQLEIVSLKLFQPDEYESQQQGIELSSSVLNFVLNYPPLPPIDVVDLPVAFLKGYWAGYSCYFREKWYAGEFKGLTPLDDFGIEYNRMVNIWTFTFPLLAVEPSIYYVMAWLIHNFPEHSALSILLRACKVYLHLETQLRESEKFGSFKLYDYSAPGQPGKIVCNALKALRDLYNFTSLNFYCPIIEQCHELTWFENSDFVMHPYARHKNGRWFFPLIPSGLFRTPHFKITTWQFLR